MGPLAPRHPGEDEISFRPEREEDLPFLRRLYASTREEELAPVPWTPEQKTAFLSMQFDAQRASYRQEPATEFLLLLAAGREAGRLYVTRRPEEIHVVDIALLPAERGKGTGTRVLSAILAEGDASGVPVTIHVEKHNPAQSLYSRLGFAPVEDLGVYLFLRRAPGGASYPKTAS